MFKNVQTKRVDFFFKSSHYNTPLKSSHADEIYPIVAAKISFFDSICHADR